MNKLFYKAHYLRQVQILYPLMDLPIKEAQLTYSYVSIILLSASHS